MKIIATSTGQNLDAALDPRFGRCAYFALIDSQSSALEAIPNPFLDAAGGAGTQAAQWVLDQNADVLITGQCGPKAAAVLRTSDIQIVEGASGSVGDLTASYREGAIMVPETAATSATAERSVPTPTLEQDGGGGRGRCGQGGNAGCGGGGRGRGRGMGRGKGLGRQGSN